MKTDISYIIGVSYARSGHHLLKSVLNKYFGSDFGYCEFYTPVECCRNVPCTYQGKINLSKNHDYKNSVPILENHKYLIQYRSFLPTLASNYELHARNIGKDNEALFRKFAGNQKIRYKKFLTRWRDASASGSTFIRVSYERLTSSPVETFTELILQFQPGIEVDRERLDLIVRNSDRRSVEKGEEAVSKRVGVAAFRDVCAFRYYDADFFEALDRDTRGIFDSIEAKPMVVKIPIRRNQASDANGADDGIVVDATGHLIHFGDVPSGIQRVQSFIVRQALSDADPRVSLVYFDWKARIFRKLSPQEFDKMYAVQTDAGKANKWWQILAVAVRQIKVNPLLGKNFEKNTAVRMVQALDAERHGDYPSPANVKKRAAYQFYKITLRIYRHFTRLGRWVYRDTLKKINGSVIFSHAAFSNSMFHDYINATTFRVFIFHDDIPLEYPEYLSNSGTADRIRPKIIKLRKIGALALCASGYAEDGVRAFDAKIGTDGQPIQRFRMPSTLYQQAAKEGRTTRISGADPFILYCSTIEVRKNHILLAEIWKDALESGNSLPPLYCVGKWGWGVEKLSDFMDSNPSLGSHVRFLGKISDEKLIDLYRSALFSVYPSYLEGWGLGASESLDFGLPVIISTAAALQEASRGLMPAIAPDDRDAWLRQIRLLAENGDALAELRQKICDKYGPVSEEESWMEIKAALRNRRP